MTQRRLTTFLVCMMVLSGIAAAEQTRSVVSVKLDEAATFAFPNDVLGSQEEIFTLPYMGQSQFDDYKSLGVTMLRYPCGTPSDWLAWDDIENGYWPSDFEKKRNKLTPDGYIDFCRKQGWATLITVNTNLTGSHNEKNRINPTRVESIRKGAAYAAKWVEHANIKNKAGVKYWEIGNEVWIWMREKEYPVYVREYAKAMRKIDPSIKIIACASTHEMEFQPTWLEFPNDPTWKPRPTNKANPQRWTKALLRDAKGSFDYLAPHIYINGDSVDPIANGKSLFANIDDAETLIYQQIRWIQEAKSPVRLAQTEWMINWHFVPDIKDTFLANKTLTRENFEKLTFENSPVHAFISVLGSADWIGKMIATGYMDIAIAHTLTFGVGLAYDTQSNKAMYPIVPKPAGVAMEFWSQFKGQRVVPVQLKNVPMYEYNKKQVPLVTAYATMRTGELNLILINRSPDRTVTVAVPTMFQGKAATKATESAVEAKSWGANIWPATKDRTLYPFKKASRNVPVETLKSYELQPCKLVRLAVQH